MSITSTQRIATRLFTAAGVAALLTVAPTVSAHAQPGTTQVAGLLEPDQDGSCVDDPASLATYDVSGSLEGCWYIDEFDIEHTSNAGGFVATGSEQFVGCLGDRCGRLFTTYTFTAKYAGEVEEHGRCHHPITGGDGDFEGVTGVINMHDLPNGCATYRGHLSG